MILYAPNWIMVMIYPIALSGSNTQNVSYATQPDSQLATISKDIGEPLTSPHTRVDNQGIGQNSPVLPSSKIALEHSQISDPITISPLLCVPSAGAAAASVTHCVTRPLSSPIVLPINSASYTNHVDTSTVDADESETSLKDQMLKSKEKSLSNEERRLKELEKKLNNKEISLSDQLDQNEFSKTYIVSMENKVKELESANRLLRLQLLSVPDQNPPSPSSQGNQHLEMHNIQSVQKQNCHSGATEPTHSYCNQRSSNCMTSIHDLQDRVLSLEVKLLEHRLSAMEKSKQWDGWVSNHNYGHLGAAHSYSRTPHGWGYAQQNARDAYVAFSSSETCMDNIDQQNFLTLTDVGDADGANYHYLPTVIPPTTSVDPCISTVSIERPCFIST